MAKAGSPQPIGGEPVEWSLNQVGGPTAHTCSSPRTGFSPGSARYFGLGHVRVVRSPSTC